MNSSRLAVLEQLDSLGWWYQHFQLPNGLWTGDGAEPGYDPQRRWEMIAEHMPADLSGKSVLDLGGNAGYFSIQMKLRGAARCVLVDPYVEFLEQAKFAASQFQVKLEMVCEDSHVYCLTTQERFDYVLLLGLLYHLKYPGIVLDRAAEMTKERIYIASAVIGPEVEGPEQKHDYDRHNGEAVLLDPGFPKLAFIEKLYGGDPTNWWLPNHAALPALMRSAGLRVIARPHQHVLIGQPVDNFDQQFGKAVYGNLVFPRYGKGDGTVHPGVQNVDATLWKDLGARAAHFRKQQRGQE